MRSSCPDSRGIRVISLKISSTSAEFIRDILVLVNYLATGTSILSMSDTYWRNSLSVDIRSETVLQA